MCRYLTATLPATVDLQELRRLFRRERFAWAPLPRLPNRLGAQDLRYVRVTGAACDCDCPLGAGTEDGDRSRGSELPTKARGWTDAKKERWLVQRHAAAHRRGRSTEESARSWVEHLERIFGSGVTERIGLIVHEYEGDLASETIELRGREPVDRAQITPAWLLAMREDVLYELSHSNEQP